MFQKHMATSRTIKAVLFLTFIAFSGARQFPDFLDALTRLQFRDHAWNDLEIVLSALYDQPWLLTINKNSTLRQFLTAVNSRQCLNDLYVWAHSLWRKEMWAIQSQYNVYISHKM